MKQSTPGCRPTTTALLIAISACSLLLFVTILTLPKTNIYMEKTNNNRRTELYESMALDLVKNGARFLEGGSTSQSLAISDIFRKMDGKIEPVLKPADPAVRAIVLYLDPHYAHPIATLVRRIITPFFPTDVWYQDPNLYHFSMFHASHHLEPVLATPLEVDAEARVVKSVANRCCELSIVLERVVLTSTGVLLGCWQVLNGTDPAVLRGELRKTLLRAPTKQLYNQVMLHTSFARLLGPPSIADNEEDLARSSSLLVFQQLVLQLNDALRHTEATIREVWFVEELDVLALALNGRLKKQAFFLLQCQGR